VGVLEELHIDEAVVKHHQLAYADLYDNTHEWVQKNKIEQTHVLRVTFQFFIS
jgi:hypothetical protein